MTVVKLASNAVSRFEEVAVHSFDEALCKAIDAAKKAGVPQGLIVALLHAHAHTQTAIIAEG